MADVEKAQSVQLSVSMGSLSVGESVSLCGTGDTLSGEGSLGGDLDSINGKPQLEEKDNQQDGRLLS